MQLSLFNATKTNKLETIDVEEIIIKKKNQMKDAMVCNTHMKSN